MNLRPPSVTALTQTSAFTAIVSQSPVMSNARMSLYTQSVHSFSFPPRPLRTAPSRFPNMIRFGNRPPLIRMSVPAHKSLLVRNVVSMLSHPVISRARLYEVIRWSGLLRCAPMCVCVCVCVCVFFPFILDIKFVGRTSRGHTGGTSHRISHPPSFCGACLYFSREKDSAIPFPRRP